MSRYHHKAARHKDQLEEMKRLEKQGKCIFCLEHLHEDSEKIEIETENWIVKRNRYPYEHTKLHLVLIPKIHLKTISELSPASREEFLGVVSKCESKFKLSSYALGMRSGDMRLNGGSVVHLHAHIVVGDTGEPNHQPVRFKMSSQPG